jgi:hypothetical protein
MVACYNYEKWAEMETYLLLMKNFPCKTIEQQIRQFHNYLYGGLMLYLATKNYANARQLIAEYQIGKTKYNTQVRLDFTIFIESLCGLTAFFEGQSDEALAWWTSIIEQTKHTTELRTQGAVRIYRLLLWAQQNEWRLLESELRNARRFLQKTNLLTAREELLFKTIDANLQQKTALYIPNLINALSDIKQPIISETTVFNRFMLDMLDS